MLYEYLVFVFLVHFVIPFFVVVVFVVAVVVVVALENSAELYRIWWAKTFDGSCALGTTYW